jgi:Flp pilus assembly CpaE family ATPase
VHAALDGQLALEAAWELQYRDVDRLRTVSPEQKYLLVVDLQDRSRALAVAVAVEGFRQIAAIAAHGDGSREELVALMQAGFRDVVPHFGPTEILETALRAAGKLKVTAPDQSGELYAFLPAKPGCGATTLATYATAVAAQRSQEPTLLLDFAIRLGITSFLLSSSRRGNAHHPGRPRPGRAP